MEELRLQGHRVSVMIKSKDILVDLLEAAGIEYINVLPKGRRDGKFGIAIGIIRKVQALYRYCKTEKPDLMLGTAAEIAWIGKFIGIPSLVFNEDDVEVVKTFARIVYPFATHIVSPEATDNKRWKRKTITYPGYQKLAYLHPNRFSPSREILDSYFSSNRPYSILRFAKLNAHHDVGAQGFTTDVVRETIRIMKQYGDVYITSERELEREFEQYRLQINPLHIHHVISFAQLYAGDSQSMAVEAAMLGTPSVRFSSFSGKIRVLEELEHTYKLTVGILPSETTKLFSTIDDLLSNPSTTTTFKKRREIMLSQKIDVSSFFIELTNQFG
jgi:predicted glycosyltransferase